MAWIVFFLIIGAIGLGATIVSWVADGPGDDETRAAAILTVGICLLLNIAITVVFSLHFVDARNVGVVRTLGSITGQVGEGVQFTWPWQTVEEWNIRLQVIEPDTACTNGKPKCMDAGSVDIQDIYVEGVLNIEVDVRDVQNLARNIGQNYTDTIVRNRLYQVVKRVTSTYRADQILANREEIRVRVRDGMIAELAPYSITVNDFLLTNIDFTDTFRVQIDAKTAAEQAALTAENVVRIKEAEARQRAAEAQGVADKLRIEAQGQAEANRLINESLTPLLVQFQALQKLADNIQIALIPSGQGIILDPATLLGGLDRSSR